MDPEKPDVFLCHNRADKPWVRELGARLEAETIDGTLTGRRIRVFLDEWDIEGGENIVVRLGEELASGTFVAVVMSPEFFESSWTAFEWTDVVARDPANKAGKILPLRRRDVSLDGACRVKFPAPFNALSYFDFRSTAHFEPEFERLLGRIRNLPPPRGRAVAARYSGGAQFAAHSASVEAAETVSEVLVSNLAPLTSSPPALYSAKTALMVLSDIPPDAGIEETTLRLAGERLTTFADLEHPACRVNAFIDPYSIERLEFDACIKETDRLNEWLALANKTLGRALRQKDLSQDEKGRFYFPPAADGKDRIITIPGQRPREVAAKKRHHTTGEEFWVHYSARIQFRVFGSQPFLRILPSYAFTHDGVRGLDSKQAGRFRVIWSGRQDSATVVRQVLFWLLFMSDGHEEWSIETGGIPIRLSVMPATAATQVGIRLDHVSVRALVEPVTDELTEVAADADVEQVDDEETDSDESDEDYSV